MTTPNKKDKEALGKGIRSLLQGIDLDLKTASGSLKPAIAENMTGILRIPLEQIETRHRLRKRFSFANRERAGWKSGRDVGVGESAACEWTEATDGDQQAGAGK